MPGASKLWVREKCTYSPSEMAVLCNIWPVACASCMRAGAAGVTREESLVIPKRGRGRRDVCKVKQMRLHPHELNTPHYKTTNPTYPTAPFSLCRCPAPKCNHVTFCHRTDYYITLHVISLTLLSKATYSWLQETFPPGALWGIVATPGIEPPTLQVQVKNLNHYATGCLIMHYASAEFDGVLWILLCHL